MAGEDDVRDDAGGVPRALSGPAPIIDLGENAVPVRPVKPLGPRRLARLQRELDERARELEALAAQPAGPDLLEKQQRFAELAAQAEAANTGPTGAGEDSAAGGGTGASTPQQEPEGSAPESPPSREPVRLEPGPAEPLERITVVFPGSPAPDGTDGHASHDPVHVDPALFGNRLAPEELAALTHIEILAPGQAEQHGPPEQHGQPEGHGSHSAEEEAPPPDEVPGPPPGTVPDDEAVPPAVPVPATRAGGLELLEPHEYRSRGGSRWWVLLLGLVLAALVVLVVLDVL